MPGTTRKVAVELKTPEAFHPTEADSLPPAGREMWPVFVEVCTMRCKR